MKWDNPEAKEWSRKKGIWDEKVSILDRK